ncbi:hypothetical protein BLOT_006814 [Blomia tropicalis]|nr:hypothetical protein BLOT_006814 [Blomia tropicalis]
MATPLANFEDFVIAKQCAEVRSHCLAINDAPQPPAQTLRVCLTGETFGYLLRKYRRSIRNDAV